MKLLLSLILLLGVIMSALGITEYENVIAGNTFVMAMVALKYYK